MTMISPEKYVEDMKDKPYMDLMKARDGLIGFLREFEHNETNSRLADSHDFEYSSKQVQYQVYMEYLSGICKLMCERYNREYVWGSRTLKQDFLYRR